MTEFHERSALFKFFYVFFRVITFPIFLVLFILTHPLWLLLILFMLVGGLLYWPMSQGIKSEELLDWYQKKYVVVKKDIVKTAKEKGIIDLVPKAVVDNVEQLEDKEARQEYGENYNIKIKQDEKSIETKNQLKKRSGFKRATVSEVVKVEKNIEDMTDEEILEESGAQGSGLADLLPPQTSETSENVAEQAPAENTPNIVGESDISDTIEVNVENAEPEAVLEEKVDLTPKEVAPAVASDSGDDDLELF